MKKSLIFASVTILTIITSLTNCQQDSVDATQSVLETPKILKSVNQIHYPTYTQVETADYQYDVKGNLIKKSFVIDRETKAENVQTETYTYNSNGFLIEKNMKNVIAEPKLTVRQNSETKKYSYTNDRVSLIETAITNNKGIISIETEKYVYDSKGGLTSIEKRIQDGATSTMVYSGGRLTDYIVKSGNGTTTHPYTIENGLVTKITGDGYYVSNTFSVKGQVLKSEIYNDGKLNSYSVYEWSDAIRAESTFHSFKGIPCGQDEMGTTGVYNKFQFFADVSNGKGEIKQLNESSFTNQTNNIGYISRIDLVNQQMFSTPTTPPTIIKSTQIFTYTN